jgi:hypothetical protein
LRQPRSFSKQSPTLIPAGGKLEVTSARPSTAALGLGYCLLILE